MQRVVRTTNEGRTTRGYNTEELQRHLRDGWEVKFVTKLNDDTIEYIIELKDTLEEDVK